jgi:hypothetical protein
MESKEIRRRNMLMLATELGGLQGLAEQTKTDAKYLSQVTATPCHLFHGWRRANSPKLKIIIR